jgi:hypothetical protein
MLTNSESGIINDTNNELNNDEVIVGQSDTIKNLWEDMKKTLTTFSHECKNLLIDIGLPIHNERTAMIVDVQPICPTEQMPFCYRDGKCYHLIKTSDGSVFRLIFANISFNSLSQHLQPKRMVRITYKEPNFRVINIFPQRLYRILTYKRFLEEYGHTINKNSLIRICSLDNQIVKVEFLEHGIKFTTDEEDSSDKDVHKDDDTAKNDVSKNNEEEDTNLDFDEDEPIITRPLLGVTGERDNDREDGNAEDWDEEDGDDEDGDDEEEEEDEDEEDEANRYRYDLVID